MYKPNEILFGSKLKGKLSPQSHPIQFGRKLIFFVSIHTEKSFRNIIKSNRNQIVFTIFRLIYNQMDVHYVPDQSENDKYNLISV